MTDSTRDYVVEIEIDGDYNIKLKTGSGATIKINETMYPIRLTDELKGSHRKFIATIALLAMSGKLPDLKNGTQFELMDGALKVGSGKIIKN